MKIMSFLNRKKLLSAQAPTPVGVLTLMVIRTNLFHLVDPYGFSKLSVSGRQGFSALNMDSMCLISHYVYMVHNL